MKKYNQYFNIFKTTLEDPGELITTIRVRYETKIWDKILETYLNTPEYAKLSYDDPYGAIYHLNIKSYIKELFSEVYDLIKGLVLHDNRINLDDDYFIICLATTSDYRKVNEQFDNEMKFLEYIQSEKASIDKHRKITVEILKDNGFEEITTPEMKQYHKDTYDQNNYSEWRLWTTDNINDYNCLKLDIDNGPNNRGTNWHLHIDNNACCTIGSADIDTVWEFNTLMEVFKSKFRL